MMMCWGCHAMVATIATVHGSHINKSYHAHGVSATHLQDSTAIRNFEDEEVYASTPVVALHNSPSRLTWAEQASSGEFIPKEALDLEEEYGGFSVNSNFLIDSVNQYTEEVINGGSNTDGAEKGECCTRSKPAIVKKYNHSNQAQQSLSSAAVQVTVQPTALSETIQSTTQHAAPTGGGPLTHSHSASYIGQDSLLAGMDPALLPKAIAIQRYAPTGGGTLTHSHLASSKDLRGTGPLASLLDITPAIVGQEERLTDASVTVGHSREIDSCAVTVNPQFTTVEFPPSMEKTGASQQDGRVSPSARVACSSAKTSSLVTVYASTPNISLQGGQAIANIGGY
ncbi:hypothetical protein F0562_022627 [Nyssa sinensis]|uniref:Uncharacterized protein n=1 Tax=Nyssa sinensis TaxID=561372 RepID=A0A5J5BSA2_9ASTE|nr:hypothetical protein F0562_022627 [Nyssa sinensis]